MFLNCKYQNNEYNYNRIIRKRVSDRLTTISRQKDSWGFYDTTIYVFCNE